MIAALVHPFGLRIDATGRKQLQQCFVDGQERFQQRLAAAKAEKAA